VQRGHQTDRVEVTEGIVPESMDARGHAGNLAKSLTYRFSLLLTIVMSTTNAPTPLLVRGLLRLSALAAPVALLGTALTWRSTHRISWVDGSWGASGGGIDSLAPDYLRHPRPGTEVQLEVQARYVVDHASTGLWLLWQLPGLVIAFAISAVAVLLLRLVSDVYREQPFTEAGPRRLRWVALTIAVAGLAAPLLHALAVGAVMSRVRSDGSRVLFADWDVVPTVAWWLAAGLVLVVAEAFRVGHRLSHDVDGLV